MVPDSIRCKACKRASAPWWMRRGVWFRHGQGGHDEWLDVSEMAWRRVRSSELCPYCGATMGMGAETCRACGGISNRVRGISVFGRRS